MKRIVYADHAATTPLSEKAQTAMRDYLAANFYNPSAKYVDAKKHGRSWNRRGG